MVVYRAGRARKFAMISGSLARIADGIQGDRQSEGIRPLLKTLVYLAGQMVAKPAR
jgi:hypothetical protein